MRSSFLLFIAVLGCFFASERAHAQVFTSIGTELLFEYAPNGRALEARQPFSVRGGYRFTAGDLYLDYSQFKASEGAAVVQVERTHHEWLVWGRRILFPEWRLKPFLAAGVGVQYENVDTTLNGETTKTSGDPRLLSSLATGLSAVVWEKLEVQVEAAISGSENFSPNPRASFGLHVGWVF